jgi:chromate transporter
MVLPGPEAQQLATYIGWLLHGTMGGIAAGVLFVLPSLLLLVILSWIYLAWHEVPMVAGVLYGFQPAVVAIVLFAAWRIGGRVLQIPVLWAVAVAAFVALTLHVPFPAVILGAGLLGILGGRISPPSFASGGGHAGGGKAAHKLGAALIDDHTPTPAHARFSPRRTVGYILVGATLWGGVLGLLALAGGADGLWVHIGWFFTKAALLTFGGAYAVLPYVYQGAVEHFHWLNAAQMMDGLALGETTPGPLIMVVAFVGFLAGWGQALASTVGTGAAAAGVPALAAAATVAVPGVALAHAAPVTLFVAGAAAAAVATFFTFLPSFLFILIGGPLVEATHGDVRLTAPLTAITAAVVGVIANLAVFFAYHTFWPQGAAAMGGGLGSAGVAKGGAAVDAATAGGGGTNGAGIAQGIAGGTDALSSILEIMSGVAWLPVALAVCAFVALARFKLPVIPVLLACGAVGVARQLLL